MAQRTDVQPLRNVIKETDRQPILDAVVIPAAVLQPASLPTEASTARAFERKIRHPEPGPDFFLQKASDVVWLVLGVTIGLIGLRVVLKLIAANPTNDFARFVYDATTPLVSPFATLAPSPAAGLLVFETSSLVAMLVYALLAWVIVRLMWIIFEQPSSGYYRDSF
jgi:uncharacterized protein YggT (Ycf19 family)